MLLAKHQAEAKRFEKANQQPSKPFANIWNQDVNHINQAVREFGNLKNQFEETRNYLAETQEELHQYQESFKELGIRDTNHLKAMISTANSIIERERERKRNSERTPGIVPGESWWYSLSMYLVYTENIPRWTHQGLANNLPQAK